MACPVENPVTGGCRIPVSECLVLPFVGGVADPHAIPAWEEMRMQQMTLGIDVACRAAHQASLADESGRFAWSGRRFRTSAADLERVWQAIPAGAALTVVMEPTRNAWVPLAAWFRRHGATVIMVPPEQSADLRDYYSKHAKSDRLDSRMLARLPLLHPEGLRPAEGLGPADALRRAAKLRASLVKRRTVIVARLDAYLELLGPQWHAAFGGDLTLNTPLRFLAAGYADPHALRRLGHTRLTRFIWRYSHGAWGLEHAGRLLAAAAETLQLWDGELSYPDLAEDIAAEARLALALCTEIRDLDTKLASLLHELDPAGIMTSAPGVGIINGAQILARLGDPARFRSLAGARSFSGLVPSLTASGVNGRHGPPTKSGDAALREALFLAADQARRADPVLAARYHRLMVAQGKHHNSALCHISTALLTKIIACWRAGTPYQIRDLDGTPLTTAQGRAIIAARYRVSDDIRAQRRTSHVSPKAGRRHQESPGAPTPARPQTTLRPPAELLDTA
jgi:transposase